MRNDKRELLRKIELLENSLDLFKEKLGLNGIALELDQLVDEKL
jgi:hypothetical protein